MTPERTKVGQRYIPDKTKQRKRESDDQEREMTNEMKRSRSLHEERKEKKN